MKTNIIFGKLIRVCPGKRHAWIESNVGPVRKPLPFLTKAMLDSFSAQMAMFQSK